MKNSNYILIVFLVLSTSLLKAQTDNVFLDRAYWKTNPTITDIDKKIEEGNDISQLNNSAFDAVCYAIMEKTDNATIKYLLTKKGNEVDKLTHDGRTYMFWAAYRDNLEIMKHLEVKGAKTNVVDSHGYSVLNFAAVTGQVNTLLYDYLFDKGANINAEKNNSGANALLLLAPFMEDMSLVNYFVSKGVDLNSTDTNGNGLFNYAAKGGNITLLKALIKKGLPYKKLNSNGGNAMLLASQGRRGFQNKLEVYQFLKSIDVTINVTNNDGRNPLHAVAYTTKELEIFKFFVENNVDVNQQDNEGFSPFMNASNSNDVSIVKYLSKHVKNINARDNKGRTALTKAINRNAPEVVTYLISQGADINTIDNNGNNVAYYLMNTFRSNNPEQFNKKLAILKANKFDISKSQGKGKTLYHIAVEKNNLKLLKTISELENIDINAKNNDGITALHLAAMKANNRNILEFLITKGADKTVKTDFEESVYDLALENELLQKQNIDISFLK